MMSIDFDMIPWFGMGMDQRGGKTKPPAVSGWLSIAYAGKGLPSSLEGAVHILAGISVAQGGGFFEVLRGLCAIT
jgi:hypothetical protein